MDGTLIRSMVAVIAVVWAAACGGKDDSPDIVMERFRHLETANALAPAELEVGAIDYVRRVASDTGVALSPADDLEVRAVVQGARDGLRHVRLKQIYRGVEVMGSEVVVHADDTTFVGINGYLTRNLDGFDITPVIGGDEAVAIAKLDRAAGADQVPFISESSRLVIAPRAAGGADLAWHIQVANAAAPALGPGLWDYLVDARSGAVLRRFDAVPLEQGSGPGGAQSGRWINQLDVEPSGDGAEGDYWMKTDRLETYDIAKSKDVPVSGSLTEMPDPFANDAHGYAEVTLDMLRDWYGFNSVDDAGRVVESYINDASICPAGSACAPLEGEARVYYTVSWPDAAHDLGVVSHEINHNFTEYHSNLTYSGEGALLHEHFSAVAQASAPFYHWGVDAYGKLESMCNSEPEGIGKPQRAFCLAVGRYRATVGGSLTPCAGSARSGTRPTRPTGRRRPTSWTPAREPSTPRSASASASASPSPFATRGPTSASTVPAPTASSATRTTSVTPARPAPAARTTAAPAPRTAASGRRPNARSASATAAGATRCPRAATASATARRPTPPAARTAAAQRTSPAPWRRSAAGVIRPAWTTAIAAPTSPTSASERLTSWSGRRRR